MHEFGFNFHVDNNKTLLKYEDLLRKLVDDGIMCVGYEQDGSFYLVECCDEYFIHNLTKEECLELSEMFKDIAEVFGT